MGIHLKVGWTRFLKKIIRLKNNKDEICQLYAIRNLIAHENSRKFYAYPNEYTLKKLKKLLEGIKTPIYVNNIIKNTPITFDVKQSILEVINAIKKYKISQFPVYKDKIFVGVVSTNTVSFWLSNIINIDGELIEEFSSITISDILSYNESDDETGFICRKTTVDELVDLMNSNKSYKLWLITETGKRNEKPLSAVSTFDFPAIYNKCLKL